MNDQLHFIFIILAFCFALGMVLLREHIPQNAKPILALISAGFVLFAFYLIIFSLMKLGT